MSAVSRVCVGEPAAVLREELAERRLRIGVLGEDALARDLGDVGRLEVDLQRLREAVHQARELDPRVVEPADELVELLLRRDDEPHLPAADAAEALDDRLEVEHLLDVAGDELPDLVDDEDERLARLAAGPSAPCSARRGGPGVMSARSLHGLAPAVGGRERLRVELVHHAARLLHRDRDQPLLGVPVLARRARRTSP